MQAGFAECAAGALVYLSSVYCLLALGFSAKLIRRRIASEREGLPFCCLAQFSDLGAGGSRSANAQRSASGFFFILAANSTILRIASARDGTSI